MKLVLKPDMNFKIVSDNSKIVMDNIQCQLMYFTRTFTFDPIPAQGEWKLLKDSKGSTVYACENYTLEAREGDNGIFIRASFRNLTNEELFKLNYFRVVTGDWNAPITNCIYNEFEETPFRLPNLMGNPVRTMCLIPEQSITGSDIIVCRDENRKENIFGFASSQEYFNELTLSHEGRLTAAQVLEFRTLEPGDEIVTDWFYIGSYDNANTGLLDYGKIVGEYGNVTSLPEIPTGWCTWYYYLMNINQEEVALNMTALAEDKEKLPIKYIQIDDGWFEEIGDWTENDKFTKKMKTIADEIKAQGYIPGIWLTPFSVSKSSRVFKEHPEYLVKDDEGNPTSVGLLGRSYAFDTTHPGALEYMKSVFRRLSIEWGFRYIKLDYCLTGVLPGKRHVKNISTLKAFRIGLKAIRESVTEDTFILACTSPMSSAVGLVDAMRISVDIGHDWPALKEVCLRVIKRFYYHNQAFINDADCLIIRKSENEDNFCMRKCIRTDNEIEVYVTVMAASGGILMLSDKMPLLSDKQIDMLSKLFPINTRAAIPLDILENNCPGILDFGKYGNTRIAALINWADIQKTMSIDIDKGHVYEFWKNEYLGIMDNKLETVVEPHSVKLFFITDDAAAVVVGTDSCVCPEIKQIYTDDTLQFSPLKPNSRYFIASLKKPVNYVGCTLEEINENLYTVVSNSDSSRCEISF